MIRCIKNGKNPIKYLSNKILYNFSMSKKLREEKLYFRENGTYVEYVKGNKDYAGYLLRRFLAMTIDLMFFAILLCVLYLVLRINIFLTAFFIMLGINIYVFTSCMTLGNRTVGMYLTKLVIVNIDGSQLGESTKLSKLFYRSTIWSFVIICVPLTALYFIANFIQIFFGRTVFVIDKLLKLQIVTKHASDRYTRIMSEWNDEKHTKSL